MPSVNDKTDDVSRFLCQVNAELGNAYHDAQETLFPEFQPYFSSTDPDERLETRLQLAYERLAPDKKAAVQRLLRPALMRCARTWMGLRRTLVCLDMAISLEPAILNDSIMSDIVLRPADPDDRALWLGELISRLKQSNIKVDLPAETWAILCKTISAKHLYTFVSYFHNQYSMEIPEMWNTLCDMSLERLRENSEEFISYGYDPDELCEYIDSLRMPGDELLDEKVFSNAAAAGEAKQLLRYVRPDVLHASREAQNDERGWFERSAR